MGRDLRNLIPETEIPVASSGLLDEVVTPESVTSENAQIDLTQIPTEELDRLIEQYSGSRPLSEIYSQVGQGIVERVTQDFEPPSRWNQARISNDPIQRERQLQGLILDAESRGEYKEAEELYELADTLRTPEETRARRRMLIQLAAGAGAALATGGASIPVQAGVMAGTEAIASLVASETVDPVENPLQLAFYDAAVGGITDAVTLGAGKGLRAAGRGARRLVEIGQARGAAEGVGTVQGLGRELRQAGRVVTGGRGVIEEPVAEAAQDTASQAVDRLVQKMVDRQVPDSQVEMLFDSALERSQLAFRQQASALYDTAESYIGDTRISARAIREAIDTERAAAGRFLGAELDAVPGMSRIRRVLSPEDATQAGRAAQRAQKNITRAETAATRAQERAERARETLAGYREGLSGRRSLTPSQQSRVRDLETRSRQAQSAVERAQSELDQARQAAPSDALTAAPRGPESFSFSEARKLRGALSDMISSSQRAGNNQAAASLIRMRNGVTDAIYRSLPDEQAAAALREADSFFAQGADGFQSKLVSQIAQSSDAAVDRVLRTRSRKGVAELRDIVRNQADDGDIAWQSIQDRYVMNKVLDANIETGRRATPEAALKRLQRDGDVARELLGDEQFDELRGMMADFDLATKRLERVKEQIRQESPGKLVEFAGLQNWALFDFALSLFTPSTWPRGVFTAAGVAVRMPSAANAVRQGWRNIGAAANVINEAAEQAAEGASGAAVKQTIFEGIRRIAEAGGRTAVRGARGAAVGGIAGQRDVAQTRPEGRQIIVP